MVTRAKCSVEVCDKPARARGWCHTHYSRWRVHGSPTSGRAVRGDGLKFLRSLLGHEGNECIKWPFATREDGRGTLWIDGRQELASRAICRLAHGEPPSDEHVAAHSCGKGHQGCVNPNNLRWATATENATDAMSHGTRLYGASNPASRLTDASVAEIRRLGTDLSQRAIAGIYGVSKTTVRKILKGETWRST